jgi:hypothetical protein
VQQLGDVRLERLGLERLGVGRRVLRFLLIGGGHEGSPGQHFVAPEMEGIAGYFKIGGS